MEIKYSAKLAGYTVIAPEEVSSASKSFSIDLSRTKDEFVRWNFNMNLLPCFEGNIFLNF